MSEDDGLNRRRFAKGKHLFTQGQEASTAYLIEKGRVRVFRENKDMEKTLYLGEMGPGEIIGEMALLSQTNHSATAEALEEVDTVEIDAATIKAQYGKAPPIMKKIIESLIKRLYGSHEKLEHLLAANDSWNK